MSPHDYIKLSRDEVLSPDVVFMAAQWLSAFNEPMEQRDQKNNGANPTMQPATRIAVAMPRLGSDLEADKNTREHDESFAKNIYKEQKETIETSCSKHYTQIVHNQQKKRN